MSTINVPLDELLTTENMDFSHRGTPLAPDLPEHYTNKRYVDQSIAGITSTGRSPAVVNLTCDGEATSYTVTHNLNTLNIATVQVYDTTSGSQFPIGIDWLPATVNTITLSPDVLLPLDMTLRVVVTA
ncbi:MAG: hypothetical protein LBK06_08765 [Planctomycetaceae bacterium]|jgi:hypothetical protein|nr:hypothetical protein [Planctomycetaceae bacterium]